MYQLMQSMALEPAARAKIFDLKSRISFDLPDDLKQFYEVADGAEGPIGSHNYLAVYPIREVILLLDEEVAIFNLPAGAKSFAFGGDGGNELYFYVQEGSDWKIYMLPSDDLSWENAVFMGNNFSNFLQVCHDYNP